MTTPEKQPDDLVPKELRGSADDMVPDALRNDTRDRVRDTVGDGENWIAEARNFRPSRRASNGLHTKGFADRNREE